MASDTESTKTETEEEEGSSDSAGSFWSTFGAAAAITQASQIEKLLQEDPHCSVDALLDDEAIIQEVKTDTKELLQRLTQEDALQTMLDLLLTEPPAEASQARCYRRPYIAAELMTGANLRLTEALVKSEVLLNSFWNFLDVAVVPEVNPVLLGYFSRLATTLLCRHSGEVTAYLRRRANLLQTFLKGLHARSVAELFARLLCTEHSSEVLFPPQGLMVQLVSRLREDDPSCDTQENLSLVIVELLTQKDKIFLGDQYFLELFSVEVVQILSEQIFSGRPASMSPALAILSSIVFHSCVDTAGLREGATGSLCSPLPPLSPASMTLSGEEDLVNIGAEDILNEGAAEAAALQRCCNSPPSPHVASPPRNHGLPVDVFEAQYAEPMLRELCKECSKFRVLLMKAAEPADAKAEQAAMIDMPFGAVRAVGHGVLSMLSLLTMLVKTGRKVVLEAIASEEVLAWSMRVFFMYPWNSLMHNTVQGLLQEVMSSQEQPRPQLIWQLLRDNSFREAVKSYLALEKEPPREDEAAADDASAAAHPPTRPAPPPVRRVGFMGHLHAICEKLLTYTKGLPDGQQELEKIDGMLDVFALHMEREELLKQAMQEPTTRPLSGARPDARGGKRPQAPRSSSRSGNGAGLNAEEADDDDDLGPAVCKMEADAHARSLFSESVGWDEDDDDPVPRALEPEYANDNSPNDLSMPDVGWAKFDDDIDPFESRASFDPNASAPAAGSACNSGDDWVADFGGHPAPVAQQPGATSVTSGSSSEPSFALFPPPEPAPPAAPPLRDDADAFEVALMAQGLFYKQEKRAAAAAAVRDHGGQDNWAVFDEAPPAGSSSAAVVPQPSQAPAASATDPLDGLQTLAGSTPSVGGAGVVGTSNAAPAGAPWVADFDPLWPTTTPASQDNSP